MSPEELKELLDQYDEAYYDLDSPVISDEEYDALKAKYLRMVSGVETEVGGNASSKFDKVKHIYPILSLEKVKDRGTLDSKLLQYKKGAVQPKLDGLTVVVYGKNVLGPTAVFATRGTGTEGEDITATASHIDGLRPIDNLTYRAEIFLPKAVFAAINAERVANGEEPFANARNAAAGMIRQSDPGRVKGLTYYAYNILGSELDEEHQLDLLKLSGIKIVPTKYYDDDNVSRANALDWIVNFDEAKRNSLPYEIDGMVIKANVPNSLELFGSTGHHPKNAIAYKYPVDAVKSTLLDVTWQLGKSGQVTPVAFFEPVEILGSTVGRATLHNLDYIKALDLRIGDEVSVIKANEIIPKIIDSAHKDTSKYIIAPTTCPVCGHQLQKEGANIYCRNIDCKGMIIAQVAHMARKECLNIDGLSTKTVTKMFDMGYLNTKFDIFNVTEKQIEVLDGYAGPSAAKLYKAIQDSRHNVPFDKFLYSGGIPLLGRTASKDIARYFISTTPQGDANDPYQRLTGDILVNRSEKLLSIGGVGDSIACAIKDHVWTLNTLRSYLSIDYNGMTVAAPVGKSMTFVITGSLYRGTRDDYKYRIEALGHKLSGSVSKKTDYLVTNELTMTTKRKKALELGVKIVDEEEFLSIIAPK